MMIERMRQMKETGWKKGWRGGESAMPGCAERGRTQLFRLQLFLPAIAHGRHGVSAPGLSDLQAAHNLKAHVLKGEKAFPVVYWDMLVKDRDGRRVSSDEYRAMTKEERQGLEAIPFVQVLPCL